MDRRACCVAALMLMVAANITFGFDIAIYQDPLSWWNFRYQWHKRDGRYFGSYQQFLADSGYTANGEEWMADVYGWYREMRVTKVATYYPYPDNFIDNNMAQDCTHIGVLNWYYPGLGTMHGDKYVDAQFRDVQVGYRKEDLEPYDPNGFWTYDSSIGTGAVRILSPLNILPDRRQCVSMSGSAGTLWKPQSDLGKFSGWDWIQSGQIDSSWFMPMHFKLTWAVDGDGPIDTTEALAIFYWYVHTWNDTTNGYTTAAWWRFPARHLILPTQAQADNWITTEFVDSANAGWYNILDENFVALDSVPWYEVRYGPAHLPDALDDIHLPGVQFGARTDVRMSVYYEGRHTFYLNRIEAYDEGAYRMFASPPSWSLLSRSH